MSIQSAMQGVLTGPILKQFPLIDDARVAEVIRVDPLFIQSGLRDLQKLFTQMEPLATAQNLIEIRPKMHAFLGKCGFLGAQALHQLCRNEIYPPLHEGRWPQEGAWFSEMGVLFSASVEAFDKEYEIRPAVGEQSGK